MERLLAAIVMAFWAFPIVADEVFGPAPEPFVDCDGGYPMGIEGTWRVDSDWTREEFAKSHPEPSSVFVGDAGSTTFTADAMIVEISQIGKLKRPYRLVGGSAHRYTLEFEDDSGARAVTTVELVPCGLVMEAQPECPDEFCEKAHDELFGMISKLGGQDVDAEKLKQDFRQARSELNRTIPSRIYYRQVVSAEPTP
ncbi:MAG: hypothetical protein OES38_06880 [Gammaproteobacteria bacterium]|nr:hypothetical protein [Gammaproteobacteria bacterium]